MLSCYAISCRIIIVSSLLTTSMWVSIIVFTVGMSALVVSTVPSHYERMEKPNVLQGILST